MTGEARTVQVPVSLPTREQIAEVVAEAWRKDGYNADRIADAVVALLSQPNPTAERHAYTCTCDACRVPLVNKVAELGQAIAGPPRPEDMAPGTTFTADDASNGRTSRWRKEPDGWFSHVVNGGRQVSPQPRIDPSTIRDVTPPKGDNAPTA